MESCYDPGSAGQWDSYTPDQTKLEGPEKCLWCKGIKTLTTYAAITHGDITYTCNRCGGTGLEATEFGKRLIQFIARRRDCTAQYDPPPPKAEMLLLVD